MVSVPVTSGSAREVQSLPTNRFRYARTEDKVGKAVQNFGQELSEAADTWNAVEATYDEADALKLANSMAAYERERLTSGEDAYLTKQGFAAGENREAVLNDLSTKGEELLGNARSERARNMARRAIQARLGDAEAKIAGHAVAQMAVARDEQSQARIDGLATDAIDARGTEQYLVHLGIAEQELRARGKRNGWGEEKTAAEVDKYRSNVLSRMALAMDAEDGSPSNALNFVEANSSLLLPGDEAQLINALAPRVDSAWASQIVAAGELNGYLLPDAIEPGDDAEAAGEPVTLALPFAGAATTVAGGEYGARRDYGGHSGVDYAGLPAGTAVPPAGGGVVTYSGERAGYGNRVEISHGKNSKGQEISTAYSHLDGRKVKVGDRVDASSVLGGVGSSGGNYGTHLHFEVMVDGQKVDPATVAGMTVTPGGATPSAETVYDSAAMREAVDRYVAANPGISERRKEALYAEAERSVGRARADRAQKEQEADRKVMDWLTENVPDPDGLTSEGQIPAAILAGASPETRSSINSRIQATKTRIEARVNARAAAQAKSAEEAAIFELYTMTDEELAAKDLRVYAGRIGLGKMGPWVDRQQKLQNGGTDKVVSADRIASKVDSLGKPYGASRAPDATEEQRQAWISLRGYVEQRVAGRADDDVSNEELRGLVAAGMAEVEVSDSGWIWNDTKPRSQLPSGTKYTMDIPEAKRLEIKQSLERRGLPSNNEAIYEAYAARRARGLE